MFPGKLTIQWQIRYPRQPSLISRKLLRLTFWQIEAEAKAIHWWIASLSFVTLFAEINYFSQAIVYF